MGSRYAFHMQFTLQPPCPTVQEGDAASYLRRAQWLIRYGNRPGGDADSDLRRAIALDAIFWEPWALLADSTWSDATLQLHFCDEAIRRGAGLQTQRQRASLLLLLDRFADAEREYSRIIDENPSDWFALDSVRSDRALARAHLGEYDGAGCGLPTNTERACTPKRCFSHPTSRRSTRSSWCASQARWARNHLQKQTVGSAGAARLAAS